MAAVFSRGTNTFWVREPGSAVDWAVGSTPLVAACVLGYSAYAASSFVPGGTARETLTQSRPIRLGVFAALPAFCAALSSTIITLVVVLVEVYAHRQGSIVVPHTLALLAPVACMYAAAAVVGACIGMLLQGPAVPFILTILGFLAFFLARPFHLDRLLRIGGSTGSSADSSLVMSKLMAWCAAFLVLALIPMAIVGHVARRMPALASTKIATAIASLGAVVFLFFSSVSGGNGYAYRTMATFPDHCSRTGDEAVCVRSDSTFDAQDTARALKPYITSVDSLGSVPRITRWGVLSIPGSAPPASAGYIIANGDASPVPLSYELAQGVLTGPGCATLAGDEKYAATVTVAGEWIMHDATGTMTPGLSAAEVAWLNGPASRQWVAHAAAALRACDLSSVTAPPGWPARKSGFTW